MASANPLDFLLNRGEEAEEAQVVDAPAFSLTKVLATAAGIVAPVTAGIVEWATDDGLNLSARHWVVLIVALLGFLAITASADVIGRSVATAAEKNAQAAGAAAGHFIPFSKPLAGGRITQRDDVPVQILAAASGDQPYLLIREGETLGWLPADKVTIGKSC